MKTVFWSEKYQITAAMLRLKIAKTGFLTSCTRNMNFHKIHLLHSLLQPVVLWKANCVTFAAVSHVPELKEHYKRNANSNGNIIWLLIKKAKETEHSWKAGYTTKIRLTGRHDINLILHKKSPGSSQKHTFCLSNELFTECMDRHNNHEARAQGPKRQEILGRWRQWICGKLLIRHKPPHQGCLKEHF